VLVPTPQFALHVSTPATGGGAHGMLFDRQDNLFLQDMTKVTRYALREK
jgi:hypothetical protein